MPRDWEKIMKRFRDGYALKDKDANRIVALCRIFHKLDVCEYRGSLKWKKGKNLEKVFLLSKR